MGRLSGYVAADYLIQHASRERRSARVSASAWDAILSHIHDPADAARLADSASNRLLYRYAIPLYRPAADAGDEDATRALTFLLYRRGDPDELRAQAAAGDRYAAWALAVLHAGPADLDEAIQTLRAAADAGNDDAAWQLSGQLARRGDLEELRARADADPGQLVRRHGTGRVAVSARRPR